MEKVIPTTPLRRWPVASFATPLNLISRGTGSAGTSWDGEDTICPAACGSAATAVVAALFGAADSCADRAGVGRRKNKLDKKTPRERMQRFIEPPLRPPHYAKQKPRSTVKIARPVNQWVSRNFARKFASRA